MDRQTGIKYDLVMSRMEWFREIKNIFNGIVEEENLAKPIEPQLILNEIYKNTDNLKLKDPKDYHSSSHLQAFSFREIISHISSLDGTSINFDQLIDSLMYLSINKKRKERKANSIDLEFSNQENSILTESKSVYDLQERTSKTSENGVQKKILQNPNFFINLQSVKIKKNNNTNFGIFNARRASDLTSTNLSKSSSKEIKSFTTTSSSSAFSKYFNRKKDTLTGYSSSKTMLIYNTKKIDLSFPEKKLTDYPEIKAYKNLIHLTLAGNSISYINYLFPITLQTLNLSSNFISEFSLALELPNLFLLNLTSNQIKSVSGMTRIKNIKEIYLINNCIKSINEFCNLEFLALLDCSHNEIENFEDIAGLAVSKKIEVLKLRGNPLSSKQGYDIILKSILPRIYYLDPLNIIEYSSFKSLGTFPFLPLKDLLSNLEEKPAETSEKKNQADSAENSSGFSKNNTDNSDSSPNTQPSGSRIVSYKLFSSNKKIISRNEKPNGCKSVVNRSYSQKNIVKSSHLSKSQSTLINSDNEEITIKNNGGFSEVNMLIAEKKTRNLSEEQKRRTNVSIVSNESIQTVKKKIYGNPIAAMMIGPPAVPNKPPVNAKAKTIRSICVDLSKKYGVNKFT